MSEPILYGDGVHDDTEAVQTIANGEAVIFEDKACRALPPGRFVVNRTIQLPTEAGSRL